MSWDQLAQRNLQFTGVENPGPAATHRAPQTFDCRPSGPIGSPGGDSLPPDELMIDWGNVPAGATASLYWPAVSATEVVALIREWGGTAPVTASHTDTLSIPIDGGISYIPIPSGTGQNFAGLLTLELPSGIRTGQQFEVVVRRLSARRGRAAPPRQLLGTPWSTRLGEEAKAPEEAAARIVEERPIVWRYVVGSFRVRVPVSTSDALLVPEEVTLAIMKWRLDHLSPGDRWAPVLKRYIEYCAARVNGMGGDAGTVPPSLTWIPPELTGGGIGGEPRRGTRCGRVAEVIYDCYGDFSGFVLEECCERHHFETRQRGIGEVVRRACGDDARVCVTVDERCGRIVRLTVTA
jgi:hypothetical protein